MGLRPDPSAASAVAVAEARQQRVYGLHAVRTLLERRPGAIVAATLLERASGQALVELSATIEALGVAVHRATRADLDRLSSGGKHQGIVVNVRAGKEFSLTEFEALVIRRGRSLRLLVLERVEDPRNLGACLRTADAVGIDAVVVPKAHSAKLSPSAMKAATGAAETVPVLTASNLARTLAWLKKAGVWVVGTDSGAQQLLYDSELQPPIALVLGGEGRGMRRLTRESCDELVAIPMHGIVESLNVSVAAGVVLYELLRQSPVSV